MNIDRGKESFTEAEIDELRTRLRAWKDAAEIGWNPMAGLHLTDDKSLNYLVTARRA